MSDVEMPKFCKDCAYCVPYKSVKPSLFGPYKVTYEFNCLSRCSYPLVLDLVTGKASHSCSSQRWDIEGLCGRDAKWFVPRATESTLGG